VFVFFNLVEAKLNALFMSSTIYQKAL